MKLIYLLFFCLYTSLVAQNNFWDDYYTNTRFEDYVTGDKFLDRYNYNSIENAIIPYLIDYRNPLMLDVGSGAGHWISFCLYLFEYPTIMAVDISDTCTIKLKEKYKSKINCLKVDFGDSVSLDKFDLIFAIGVLHHIVEDNRFQRALNNIHNNLENGGLCFIATELSGRQFKANKDIYKKYRKLPEWESGLDKAGLHIVETIINDGKLRKTPNDVLIVRRK